MRITRSNPVLAALATVLSLWSLTVLIESPGWLVGTIGYLVVIGVVGAGLRRLGWTGLAVLATQTVAVALSAIWLHAGETTWYGLPTPASLGAFLDQFTQFGQTVYVSAAPLPSSRAVTITMSLIGAAVGLIIDYVAVGRGAASAAGIPLLVPYLAAAANRSEPLPWGFFIAAALGFLILVGSHMQRRLRGWQSAPARALQPTGSGDVVDLVSDGFGTAARRLGLIAVVTALTAGAALPHLPTRYLLDGLARSDTGVGRTRIGFASSLDVSRSLIGGNPSVVLRYRTSATSPAPLRVVATSTYDGTTWSRPIPSLGPTGRQDLDVSVSRTEATISVEDYTLSPPALAAPQPLVSVDLGGVGWQVDEPTADVYVQAQPASYSATYVQPAWSADLLRNGIDGAPGPDRLPTSRTIQSALRLDLLSAAAVRAAAAEAVEDLGDRTTPYDRAMAIQRWLRQEGGFAYSLDLDPSNGLDPITAFLQSRRGYCVQFATAMVMMARAEGIPARMAIGFLPGTMENGVYTVSSTDAHTWPELYFPGAGWVRFEPTPGSSVGPPPAWTVPPATAAPTSSAGATASAPSGSSTAPTTAPRGVDTGQDGLTLEVQPTLADRVGTLMRDPRFLVAATLLVTLLCALVLPVTAALVRRRRHDTGPPPVVAAAAWSDLTSRLTDLGLPPPPGGTLRDWRDHYSREGHLQEPARDSLATMVATVERAQFARPGTAVDLADLPQRSAEIVAAVGPTRAWRHRVRAFFLPSDARVWWRRRYAVRRAQARQVIAQIGDGFRRRR